MSNKRDAVYGEGVSDQDIQRQYNINPDPMAEEGTLVLDGGQPSTSRYEGKQPKPSVITSRPGAAENGGGGY